MRNSPPRGRDAWSPHGWRANRIPGMPGIFGAVSLRRRPLPHLPFDDVAAALRTCPALETTRIAAADGGAVLGAVDLGRLQGSGTVARAPDGSIAVVHGAAEPLGADAAAAALTRYRRDPDSLTTLTGSFTIALWDAPARTLVLVNDRFGLRNLYYTVADGLVCFAPLVHAVAKLAGAAPSLNQAAMADLLAFEHALGDETLLADVRALPPATIARFGLHGADLSRYWRPRYVPMPERHAGALADELARRLAGAVEQALDGGAVALPTSGGLDSRALLAVTPPGVPCVTYGIPGCDDVELAARLAATAGAPHHTIPLEPGFIARDAAALVEATDGMHLGLNVHALRLREAAAWCDAVLLGNGGDCILDCLWWWRDEPASEDDFVARMYERINLGVKPAVARRLLAPPLVEQLTSGARERLRRRLALYAGATAADVADAYNAGERHWRWVLQGVPAQATHVEYRQPFYDYDVVDLAQRVPVALRRGRLLHVEMIRRRAPALARIRQQGGGHLVASPLARRWRGRWKRARRAAN